MQGSGSPSGEVLLERVEGDERHGPHEKDRDVAAAHVAHRGVFRSSR